MSFHVVVVDNRDSFVHTLASYVADLGARVTMHPATAPGVVAAVAAADAVLVSPGPGHPVDAGASIDVVRAAHADGIPLLGVCLGHQALAVAFGAEVTRAPELLHGITSSVHHDGLGVFADLPDGFRATRYHSLAVDPATVPDDLVVTARSESGVIMGLAHRNAPLTGVQFHPESILTEGGHALLGRWLEDAGLRGAAERGRSLHPRRGQGPVQ
ncbi:anthranilate synthase component II [Microbacterium sp. IEGM 1404]|uniref:anthranilate synthase component II n=1 Tax=Microbacterium sp. IEGM 1404 TaxID=3047084 RepID=UPI0024B8600C|nr:gamma-glutamyl-gamma-aminobutyrate hydrolase family protein [Microbacterium sp. IEGM 1404]MDI9892478.1 gamma-glutamyl-gamma-aminobutyrate hydrolase family protein [Microbacterium sp. IEGM 1404]